MTIAWKLGYVKWRNRRYNDRPNAVSGTFAESKFLSLRTKVSGNMSRLPFAFVVALWAGASLQVGAQTTLQQLYDDARWFELRDAIADREAPALYHAAVASAFNRSGEAETEFKRAIRESSDATVANAGRDGLASLYLRTGRYGDALKLAEEMLTIAPERVDIRNFRSLLASAGASNQQVTSSRRARFACETGAAGVRIPLSIDGHTVHWAVDTGFTQPGLSEAEALMLGLVVHDVKGEATDGAGGATTVRTAVADRVTIGATELRHVLMLVFPDSQPPWNEWQPGQRGLVGLPIALALQNIRWTSRGTCETGPLRSRARDSEGNLMFNGLAPVIRVAFDGRPLSFYLDTGNMAQSQLWSRFAEDFAALVAEQGKAGSVSLTQIGGSNEHDTIVLREVRMRVGGFDTLLRPANIFFPPVGDTYSHGNLGMDLLSQASEVTIDFQSMVVILR